MCTLGEGSFRAATKEGGRYKHKQQIRHRSTLRTRSLRECSDPVEVYWPVSVRACIVVLFREVTFIVSSA
jgi:hypothetical protein